ncbi:hypothetical protein [Ramlibacter sp. 2FC]|uniref:hypothetical protein n=1 Tax=Ramlibacter sp. 2FC TaxID=2502188 RepID=UPI0010F7D59F|nr:hypothetical protein [Ramlibacter sp. 2FC]
MTGSPSDLAKIRLSLRQLSRGEPLIIAERAAALVPSAALPALLGDFVQIEVPGNATTDAPSLLDEVREFHANSMSGAYYESFAVNGRNCTQRSKGTDAFIAEFDRLVSKCISEADTGPQPAVREAFELLFGLLRHIDEGHDDLIFFADEGSARDVGVHWRAAFPAYFRCLAETAAAEAFARIVDQAITHFAGHDRRHHMAQAWRVATAAQQAALTALAPAQR